MAEDTTSLRKPESTWEYAVSAADLLTLLRAQEVPALAREPLRTSVTVLIGAALYTWSQGSRAEGPAVTKAPLARLLTMFLDFGQWFADCPATPGLGKEQKDELLRDLDQLAITRYAAIDVLSAHLQAAADPAVTVHQRVAPGQAAHE